MNDNNIHTCNNCKNFKHLYYKACNGLMSKSHFGYCVVQKVDSPLICQPYRSCAKWEPVKDETERTVGLLLREIKRLLENVSILLNIEK